MIHNFTASYINHLNQFGKVDYDLLIVNDEGIIPSQRIRKSFNLVDVNDQFLTDCASDEIERIVAEWEAQQQGGG